MSIAKFEKLALDIEFYLNTPNIRKKLLESKDLPNISKMIHLTAALHKVGWATWMLLDNDTCGVYFGTRRVVVSVTFEPEYNVTVSLEE